jgi:hypothetical protein
MSASSIINSLSYSHPAVNYESFQYSSQRQPTQLPGTTAKDTGDIVHLSQFAQMAQQGQSASAIAGATGLSVSVVERDLGIPTIFSSAVTSTPAHTLSVWA